MHAYHGCRVCITLYYPLSLLCFVCVRRNNIKYSVLAVIRTARFHMYINITGCSFEHSRLIACCKDNTTLCAAKRGTLSDPFFWSVCLRLCVRVCVCVFTFTFTCAPRKSEN